MPSDEAQRVRRLKWVLGTPYFVQGTSALVEVPTLYFIKFVLGLGDAGGQLFDSLRAGGWFLKPVWGYISDRFPLLGYRRKSWFVGMAALGVLLWGLNAALAFAGVRVPLVFFITFNMAFATYAFVDVVCDAIMVERGRQLRRVGSFVNFQWTVLAIANAGAVYLGGWFEQRIQDGAYEPWMVFLATGVPPLATAIIGLRNIEEKPASPAPRKSRAGPVRAGPVLAAAWRWLRAAPGRLRAFRRDNRVIWLLALFLFFWNFSPSVGYIERSYLIDVRGFNPESFGIILGIGGLTFLVSVLFYRWFVNRFPAVAWHRYLYAMIGIGALSFPLSFFLYLDPGHPWWRAIYFTAPDWLNPFPEWNRYEWFRLIFQTVLGFATIPAFMIPLTLSGETVKLSHAGMGYAFLTALTNATNMIEGAIGAGLYRLFTTDWMEWLVAAFEGSVFDIAATSDERTLVLELFVYISLGFTLLTLPFVWLLRRELDRLGLEIRLGGQAR